MAEIDSTTLSRFWSKVEKSNGCWLWTARINHNGYGTFMLRAKPHTTVLAHRLSWVIHHHADIPTGKYILHECDVRRCVNPLHLKVGTIQDNYDDMKRRGREVILRGEMHGMAKLTMNDVIAIRAKRINSQVTFKELGTEYSVSESTVSRICRNDIWRCVE